MSVVAAALWYMIVAIWYVTAALGYVLVMTAVADTILGLGIFN